MWFHNRVPLGAEILSLYCCRAYLYIPDMYLCTHSAVAAAAAMLLLPQLLLLLLLAAAVRHGVPDGEVVDVVR